MYTGHSSHKRKEIYRERNAPVREGVIDAQDGQGGVWTPQERDAEAIRKAEEAGVARSTVCRLENGDACEPLTVRLVSVGVRAMQDSGILSETPR